jgi:hypothetical protein
MLGVIVVGIGSGGWHRLLVGERSAGVTGLEGGDGRVDEDLLVGGVGEVDGGLGGQWTPDRSERGLGAQGGGWACVRGDQQGSEPLVLRADPRADRGMVRTATSVATSGTTSRWAVSTAR